MSFKFTKTFTLPLEQEILSEERNYAEGLKADKTFEVLKAIKQKIKMLKAELNEHVRHNQMGEQ